MDGLHRYLVSIAVHNVPMLLPCADIPNLGYANDTALRAPSAHSLQHLIDTVSAFCILMGMIIHKRGIDRGFGIQFKVSGPISMALQWSATGDYVGLQVLGAHLSC